ncbi:hypothetical protein HGRIS_014599 [Hohenbuehelia grisea]|uniref:Uncharacterized protein n=1 Tax=Hohenbuehelia grisea TaxID=104357 RepID=A0ABR3JW41_9AGAR
MATSVDILILGAGWTSTYLTSLCQARSISYAATTRSGRDGSLMFDFEQEKDDDAQLGQFESLPDAATVVITFPIIVNGASAKLVRLYNQTRRHGGTAKFIQLGTTSIWDGASKNHITASQAASHQWYDRHSTYVSNARSTSEDELLALSPNVPTTILHLSGLWGGQRDMRKWVGRVAPTKDALRNKGSIHMIHGHDVARAILAVHSQFPKASGQRWLLTDGRVYDWWDLASAWGASPPSSVTVDSVNGLDSSNGVTERTSAEATKGPPAWVLELMLESGVRALPRDTALLGRALDSREFWREFGLLPERARLDKGDL